MYSAETFQSDLCSLTEDFVTPSSTPPQELEETSSKTDKSATSVLSDIFSENLSEAVIRDKIYDK